MLLQSAADTTSVAVVQEGTDDRRSSPRTVLAVHWPPVIVSVTTILTRRIRTMTNIRERRTDEEPMGIVISSGSRTESVPRFAAYVWSQVGETAPSATEPRAA
jgi:hypothetical protein